MTETQTIEWRTCSENPRYSVNNRGEVRGPRGRILRPGTNGKYGYLFVQLGEGNGRYVHRLVADAFIAPVGGMDVDHIDGDPSNNVIENLRVVTHAENMELQRERKPACKRGHLYAEHGAWTSEGRRYCRTCRQAWEKGRQPRVKSKKAPAMTTAEALRDLGMEQAENASDPRKMLHIDAVIARANAAGKEWSANDIRDELPVTHGPLVGARVRAASMRRPLEMVHTGKFVPSTLPSTRGARVAVWMPVA